MCSQCADVSDYLRFSCIGAKVDWTQDLKGGNHPEVEYPNATMCGYFLNFTKTPTMMSGYLLGSDGPTKGEALLVRTTPMVSLFEKSPLYGNGSINFPHVRNPIADVLIVSAANGIRSVYQDVLPVAHECILTWCVKTVKSSYNSGSLNEDIVATILNTTVGGFPWVSTPGITPSGDNGADVVYKEDINIEGTGIDWSTMPSEFMSRTSVDLFEDTNFGLSNRTASAIMTLFDDMFPSFYTAKNESSEPFLRYQTYLAGPAYTRRLPFNPWLAPNNVTTHMARLATAMTNQLRTFGTEDIYRFVPGAAYRREVYVHVQWGWLAFPLALTVLSLAFLIATIKKTADNTTTGVWKTSAMPTLIYGLPKETQDQLNPSVKGARPHRDARSIRVKLSPKMGWRVSGQSFLNRSPVLTNQPPPGWI